MQDQHELLPYKNELFCLILSTIFFLLFVFTALTSSISLLEVVVANLIEIFNWTRSKACIIAGLLCFIVGIQSAVAQAGKIFPHWKDIYGSNFFETINYLTGSWMMPLSGFFAILFIGWIMEKKLVHEEFLKGTGLRFILKPWFFLV
ncbi:MAG: hypothetical protein DRP87_15745, partial [Spirochaetes bacterium]